ncbi:uncharacterized protein LOC143240950 [Tachypleus tridentatus]|uniref:uncharacterized protein LOC143240950 n=1 Tax=Tachypleus tridentatus TaxID=6853 RepID=UPI003FD4A7DC
MSHTVTVTRTTTATGGTSSGIIIHSGYFRALPGILQLLETILGAICLGLIGYYGSHNANYRISGFVGGSEEVALFLTSFGFLVTTFLLMVSCFVSFATSSFLPKTLFEFLYHVFAFVFYLGCSLALLIVVSRRNDRRYYTEYGYEGKMAASVLGLVNAFLYLVSAIFSFRSYRHV